jgi:hypothetical protein
MTIHALQPKTSAATTDAIEFKKGYFVVDYDNNAVTFTLEGETYYSAWFNRFGFKLDARDAKAFFEAVMFINREVSGMQPEVLEQKLQDPAMSEQERSLWSKYLAGDYEAFAQDLTNMADALQGEAGAKAANVIALKR